MSDSRYHFFYVKPNQAPKWASTRTDRTYTMHRWIKDLRKRYDVVSSPDQPRVFLLYPKEAA